MVPAPDDASRPTSGAHRNVPEMSRSDFRSIFGPQRDFYRKPVITGFVIKIWSRSAPSALGRSAAQHVSNRQFSVANAPWRLTCIIINLFNKFNVTVLRIGVFPRTWRPMTFPFFLFSVQTHRIRCATHEHISTRGNTSENFKSVAVRRQFRKTKIVTRIVT